MQPGHAGGDGADPSPREDLLARLAEHVPPERLWFVAGGGALVIFVLVLSLQYSGELTLPAKPPPPPPADRQDLRRVDFTPAAYAGYLEKDAATYGVDKPSIEEMSAPFPYEKLARKVFLVPGGESLDMGMLRLTALARKEEVASKKGRARAEHLVLRIENKTDHAVAYRVDTEVNAEPSTCAGKAVLAQNAVAIPPHGSVERTECLYRDNMELHVSAVESMQLPPLAYFYVSRVFPEHAGLDARVVAGHQPPKGAVCATIPQQTIMIGMQNGSISWRDVMDYYARHRCETYDFPEGYRAMEKPGQITLPVGPDSLKAAGQ